MSTKFVLLFYFGDDRPSVYTFESESQKQTLSLYLDSKFSDMGAIYGKKTLKIDDTDFQVCATDYQLQTLDEWFDSNKFQD